MAYASWLNISIAHGRSGPVYRLWDAVANKLGGITGMGGTWTVVDNSTGGVPTWGGDTDPPDGSWVVIQSESAWSGGEKLQVFLGFRNTTGDLAGFGSKSAGLYCAFSPDGQWDTVNHYFGSSLADWRNGSLASVSGYTSACVMCLILTSGSTNRAGSFYLLTRIGTGVHTNSHCVISARPPTGMTESLARTLNLRSVPSSDWKNTAGSYGKATKTSVDGFDNAYINQVSYGLDRDTSMFVEMDGNIVIDHTTRTPFGLMDAVYQCFAADGDTNADGNRWAWEGYSWPRDPARDGVWT